jgi:hypothetical protein
MTSTNTNTNTNTYQAYLGKSKATSGKAQSNLFLCLSEIYQQIISSKCDLSTLELRHNYYGVVYATYKFKFENKLIMFNKDVTMTVSAFYPELAVLDKIFIESRNTVPARKTEKATLPVKPVFDSKKLLDETLDSLKKYIGLGSVSEELLNPMMSVTNLANESLDDLDFSVENDDANDTDNVHIDNVVGVQNELPRNLRSFLGDKMTFLKFHEKIKGEENYEEFVPDFFAGKYEVMLLLSEDKHLSFDDLEKIDPNDATEDQLNLLKVEYELFDSCIKSYEEAVKEVPDELGDNINNITQMFLTEDPIRALNEEDQ